MIFLVRLFALSGLILAARGDFDLEQAQRLAKSYNCPAAIQMARPLVLDSEMAKAANNLIFDCLQKMEDYETFIQEAREKLEEAGDVELALDLAKVYLKSGRKEEGNRLLEDLADHNETNLGVVLAFDREAPIEKNEKAVEALKRYLNFKPNENRARLALAKRYLNSGSPALAMKEAGLILVKGPLSKDLYLVLGRSEAAIGRLDQSVEALKNAIKMAPYEAEPYVALSKVYFHMGDFKKAEAAVVEGLAMAASPDEGNLLLLQMARLQIDKGQNEIARSSLLGLLKDSKVSEVAHYLWIRSFLEQKDYAAAEKELESYIEKNQGKSWAILARARLYLQSNQKGEAERWVNKHLGPTEYSKILFEFLENKNVQVAERLPAAMPKFFVVQKGDTLRSISRKLFGKPDLWEALYRWNREILTDPNFLREGKRIRVSGDDL